jgi:hypothetical protein
MNALLRFDTDIKTGSRVAHNQLLCSYGTVTEVVSPTIVRVLWDDCTMPTRSLVKNLRPLADGRLS